MEKWKSLLCVTGLILLVGCNTNDETASINSNGQTTTGSSEPPIEKPSNKDLNTAFLDYMGVDELEHWRELNAVGDGEEKEELEEIVLIDADKLAKGWGIEYPYEVILPNIEAYLQREGFETVSAELVLEYLNELYRIEGFQQNIYDSISYIAARLEEDNTQEVRAVSNEEWQILSQTQKNVLAKQLLKQSTMYADFLPTRYDMEDIPPELLTFLVDRYAQVYDTSYIPNVMHYMENVLKDMLLAEDHMVTILNHLANGFNTKDYYILDSIYTGDSTYSSGFSEESLQYQSFNMEFDFIETIKMDPYLDTYYGVVDMTYSYTANKEKLKEYEEENNKPYPEERLFNGGKDVTDKKVRTLVVIKKNIDTEFGFAVRSLYEIDGNTKFVSEFIKN
ncbi:MAG TPA: hypothetical protein VNR38_06260 [Ureibacillus sp.]|nr:hypothetical protein [Ureibacillus sp.]